jgi:hypothetical protein
MSPLDGSTLIYKKFVVPFFYKNQGAIDNVINRGKEKLSSFADEAIDKGTTVFRKRLSGVSQWD